MDGTIGKLSVEISVDTSGIISGLAAAKGEFTQFSAAADKMMTDSALGVSNNMALPIASMLKVLETKQVMDSAVSTADFAGVGRRIVGDLTSGLEAEKGRLFSAAQSIADGLKSRLTIRGTVSATGKGQTASINVNWYDMGGLFTSPQIIGVGEKRPEFVGAAEDLQSFIERSVYAAFSALPGRQADAGGGSGGDTYVFSPTVNAKSLSESEVSGLMNEFDKWLGKRSPGLRRESM